MPLLARSTVEDLVGWNFGRLTVRTLLPSSNKYDATHWRCDCDCGRTVTVTDYHLRNLKGCGDRHCRDRRYRPQPEPTEGGTNMERAKLRGNGATPTTLEQRITRALAPDQQIAPAVIATLYGEVESAIAQAETTAADSKKKALDPSIDDSAAARVQRDDAVYRLERLKAALPPLQERYTALRTAERRTQWRTDYAKVKAKRDATAEKLQAIYELTEQLIEVLEETKQVDQEVARINSTASSGEHDRLLTVECWARGVNGVGPNSALSLLTELKLPRWSAAGLAWPPPPPVLTAEMVAPIIPHPGDRWWEHQSERKAQADAEAARVANYYRRQEREKEDMENARARAEQERRRQAAST